MKRQTVENHAQKSAEICGLELPVNYPDTTGFCRFLLTDVENPRYFPLRRGAEWKTLPTPQDKEPTI